MRRTVGRRAEIVAPCRGWVSLYGARREQILEGPPEAPQGFPFECSAQTRFACRLFETCGSVLPQTCPRKLVSDPTTMLGTTGARELGHRGQVADQGLIKPPAKGQRPPAQQGPAAPLLQLSPFELPRSPART